jgi:hypothetical protein
LAGQLTQAGRPPSLRLRLFNKSGGADRNQPPPKTRPLEGQIMTNLAKIDTSTQGHQLPADPMVSMIERVAMDPSLPVERLTALMDMRERQLNKEAEQVFNQAFAAAMAEMPDVPKSGKNNHSGQKYSTLDDLIRTTRPVLARHGLSLNWQTSASGNEYSVTAIVRHAMGHSIQTTLTGARDNGKQMNALQGGGSTETYLKRYTGFSILGLSSGDEVEDDGRTGGDPTVNADQYIVLRDLIEATGTDETKFHRAHGHKDPENADLHQFPARLFETAKSQLERKKSQMGAANA